MIIQGNPRSGQTLMELLIATAIFLLIVDAASSAYITVVKNSKNSTINSSLDQSTHDLSNYFMYRINGVGGGSVRPWASLWVEDNAAARSVYPDGAGTDRLTLVEVDTTLSQCPITGVSGSSTLKIGIIAGTCCLTPAYNNRQAVLVNNAYYSQQFLSKINLGSCSIDVSPGQAYGGINSPPNTFNGWTGGSITVAAVSTLYVNPTRHELHQMQDANNNGVVDPGEDQILSYDVVDLQVALGYDCNPQDGKITDTQDTNDEWLYNATGPNEALGVGGLTGGVPNDLRMIAIGIVLGKQAPVPPFNSVSVLNGPTRQISGWHLNKSLVRFRLRNIGVFLTSG